MSQGFIGEKLGSFRLDETLGSGAMGIVFKATHEPTGRFAAVKIMHSELGQKGKVYDRFVREAEILKQLSHPNIVRWFAWGRYKGTSYFAMEYIEGSTLERILQERGSLPWREAVDLTIQLCDALQAAHDRKVIHRDLKPSNLMITQDGTLKLSDFGIAKDLDRATQLTAPGRTLGTASYMAPEQIRGTPAVSHKTDLYALGILLYQTLTGQPPFEGASAVVVMHNHLNQEPPRPSDKVTEIPKAVDELVVRLMSKAPADRPWDADAVSHELRELREKDKRGEAISMVWPQEGSGAANPTRMGASSTSGGTRSKKKARKSGTQSAISQAQGGSSGWPSRGVLEVLGMIAALVVIGGFIGYWVWPPSADYLYRHAEPLMASKHRSDWLTARDEYFEPLATRFPDSPYLAKVNEWRDQIAVDEARSRADVLASRLKLISEPATKSERTFVSFEAQAKQAAAEGNEVQAMNYWKEMAGLLKPDDRDERPWHLLALERAGELESRIRQRHEHAVAELLRAQTSELQGKAAEARAIRDRLRTDFGNYSDIRPLLGPTAPQPDPHAPTPGTAPVERPDAPPSPPEHLDPPIVEPPDKPE